jgi:hypothetical protein
MYGGGDFMRVVDSVAISVWHSLSFSHLRLANEMTRLSRELEETFTPEKRQQGQELVKPYAIGGIMASVSFLEGNINELIEKIVDKPDDYTSLTKECKQEVIGWWNEIKTDRGLSIIGKYQQLLKLCRKKKFIGNNELFKSVNLLQL